MDRWGEILQRAAASAEVSTHSHRVGSGDVFVALPGTHRHGTEFVPHALERGAGWAVVPQDYRPRAGVSEESLVRVEDTRDALGELARARYGTNRLPCRLIGVTGTNGKTTVCYLLEHLFRSAGYRVGVLGTISYRWPGHEESAGLTTPDCLSIHALLSRMAASGTELVCMEVSSHGLEQKRVAGICFDAALFTNLSREHLDYHLDMEHYFQSKNLLFTRYLSRGGPAVLNLDDPFGQRIYDLCDNPWGYSLGQGIDSGSGVLRGQLKRADRSGLCLQVSHREREWEISSPLVGSHNAGNLLAAQAMGLSLGLREEDLSSLRNFSGVPGRLEWVPNKRGLNIFVDYAHTPDALANLLESVRNTGYRRILVLFGCGGERDREKRPRMGRVVAEHADLAFLTSDNPRSEDPERIMAEVMPGLQAAQEVVREPDRRQAIRRAIDRLQPKDVLLIAGKGHEAFQEVGGQRIPFSDREEVLSYLRQLGDNPVEISPEN